MSTQLQGDVDREHALIGRRCSYPLLEWLAAIVILGAALALSFVW